MNALAGLGLSGAYNRSSSAGQMLAAAPATMVYAPALTTPPTFVGVGPREAPPPPPPPDVTAESEGETSKTKIAVIAGGLILLAVVAYFLAK